jgi:hypothetical protein
VKAERAEAERAIQRAGQCPDTDDRCPRTGGDTGEDTGDGQDADDNDQKRP